MQCFTLHLVAIGLYAPDLAAIAGRNASDAIMTFVRFPELSIKHSVEQLPKRRKAKETDRTNQTRCPQCSLCFDYVTAKHKKHSERARSAKHFHAMYSATRCNPICLSLRRCRRCPARSPKQRLEIEFVWSKTREPNMASHIYAGTRGLHNSSSFHWFA